MATAPVAGVRAVIDMLDHNRSIAIVARNSKWSLTAFAIGVASNLILLPYVVRLIGIRQFGMCGLLISVCAPLSLIGGTLGQTICQSVARSRARNDRRETRDACAIVAAFAVLCIAAGAALLVCLIPVISRRLMVAESPNIVSIPMVTLLLTVGWAAQQCSLIMQGIHVACMAYRRMAAINAIGAALNIAITGVNVRMFPSVAGYLGALCGVQVVTCIAWLVSILLTFRWCLVRPEFVKGKRDSILAFSGWLTASQIVASLSAQADRYVLGAWKGAVAVGYFNIAQRVEEAAYSVMVKASDSLFPYFSSITSDGHRPHAQFYFNVSWLMNLAAAAVIAPLIPWAPSIVGKWVNPETAAYTSAVLRILAVAGLMGCASHVFRQYMLGARMTRQLTLVTIFAGALAALVALSLVPVFGLRAAGLGAAAGAALQLGFVIHLARRHFGDLASFKRIFQSTVVPLGAALAITGLMAWYGMPELHSWPKLIGAYGATSAGILLGAMTLNGLFPEGRKLLSDLRTLLALARAQPPLRGDPRPSSPLDPPPAPEPGAAQAVDMSPPA